MNREPIYFGAPDRSLFGWLHLVNEPASLGLVICNPFGFEAICTHRSLRHFAEAAAAAGVPALRFDYEGAGDSSGDDLDPDRMAAWVKSAQLAADELRRLTGVERVCFLGVRLGALLAALAAADRKDCEGLIAVAPVVSGRSYLRELRALQVSLGLTTAPPDATVEEGVQEAIGFRITSQTRSTLEKVDLLKLESKPAPSVLMLDRADLPTGEKWAALLTSKGVAVERRLMPGYVEMALDPHLTVVPDEMVHVATEWLRTRTRPAPATDAAKPTRRAHLPGNVIESGEYVDAERRLFGIFSTSASPPSRRRAILLLNSGSIHHVGPNRLHVVLARRWAALGHAVLRFDISGIGDSRPGPGEPENVVYTGRATEDVRAAVAWLRRQSGVVEVDALGLCSGAYHAFKAAVGGAPLDSVLCLNPLTFFFKPGMSLAVPAFKIASESNRYAQRARSLDAWKKLFRGDVNLGVLAKVLIRRATDVAAGRAREVARILRLPLSDDLASELQTIARRNIDLRFTFAGGDPGLTLLETDGGTTVSRLRRRGRLTIDVIEGADHTFTPLWSQTALVNALGHYLDGPPRR